MRISLEKLLDKQVFIVLRDIKILQATGLDREQMVVTLRGYEERQGVWVELESIRNCPVKSGDLLLDNCPVMIFIPWYHIVTMIYFPGKESLEIALPRERKIGFRQE